MESLSRRDGKSIAEIGYYDPIKKIINMDKETFQNTLMPVHNLQILCDI